MSTCKHQPCRAFAATGAQEGICFPHGSAEAAGVRVASCASQSATGRPQGGNGRTNCRADWAKRGAGASGRLVVGAGWWWFILLFHAGRDGCLIIQARTERLGGTPRQAPPFPGGPSRGEQASSRAFNRRGIGEDRYLCDGGGGCHWTELGVQRCALLEQQTKQAVWLGGSYSWEPSMAACQWTTSTAAAGAPPRPVLPCCAGMRAVLPPPAASGAASLLLPLRAALSGLGGGVARDLGHHLEQAGVGKGRKNR